MPGVCPGGGGKGMLKFRFDWRIIKLPFEKERHTLLELELEFELE